ncbi:MAG: leucine-rich repeat protein [Anaerotignum sp.]|nr:leucine-rich repeat protein [Anaerotignum sp.]
MKRMKKFTAMVLSLVLVLAVAPMAWAANPLPGANIKDGVLIGYYGEGGDIVIPNSVTMIAGDAFKGNEDITGVTIPGSVSMIGYSAFENCLNLERIIFSDPTDGAEMIIRVNAFRNCPKLTECEIPAVATYVTANVFKGCTSMEEIKVHPENPYYVTDEEGVLFGPWVNEGEPQYGDTDDWAVTAYPSGKSGTYTIPKQVGPNGKFKVGRIWAGAFEGAKGLKEVEIQDNIKIVGGHAFSDSGLTKLYIPETVERVDTAVFQNCEDLTEVSLPSCMTELGMHLFLNCTALQRIDFSRCQNLTQLGLEAFMGCDSITNFVIPPTVRTIGSMDMDGMKNLARVYIPAGVTNFPVDDIGAYNFMDDAATDLQVYVVEGSTGAKWAQLRAEELDLNVTVVPAGTNPETLDIGKFNLADLQHKVKLAGSFKFGSSLDVKELTSGSEYAKFQAANAENGMMRVYEVRVLPGGNVLPDDLTISFARGEFSKNVQMAQIVNGSVRNCEAEVTGSTVSADVSELGYFALMDSSVQPGPQVETAVTEVRLNKTAETVEAGKKVQLTATVLPTTAMNKVLEWKSSNERIATVDRKGVVTGVAEGTAVITATAHNGVSNFCTVTVRGGDTPVVPGDDVKAAAALKAETQAGADGKAAFRLELQAAENIATVQVTFQTSTSDVVLQGKNGFTPIGAVKGKTENGIYTGTAILGYLSADGALFQATESTAIASVLVNAENPTLKITELKIAGWGSDKQEKYGILSGINPDEATFIGGNPYDVNRDGKVDQLDVTKAIGFYQVTSASAHWETAKLCDVNGDNMVNINDFVLIWLNFTE